MWCFRLQRLLHSPFWLTPMTLGKTRTTPGKTGDNQERLETTGRDRGHWERPETISMKSTSANSKRDGQHETPPASVNYPEAKSAPGFSLQSPGCRQSGQEVIPDKSANSSNSTNAAITPPPSANDAEIYHETVPFENDQILPNEFDQPVQSPSDDKSPPSPITKSNLTVCFPSMLVVRA